MRRLTPNAVDIHTGDPRLGKDFFKVFLDPFRPEIALDKPVVSTGRTSIYRRIDSATVVTMQLIGQFMKIKRHIAIATLRNPAANFANLVRGISPPVLEKNNLFARRQGAFDGGM